MVVEVGGMMCCFLVVVDVANGLVVGVVRGGGAMTS